MQINYYLYLVIRLPTLGRFRRGARIGLYIVAFAVAAMGSQPFAVAYEGLRPSSCSTDPRYPEPDEPGQVFYLQRSNNPNTVIYAANLGANGWIDRANPVQVYWRTYNDQGEKKRLSFLERRFAYGMKYRRNSASGRPVRFTANLVSLPSRKIDIAQPGPGEVTASLPISGTPAELVCVYVEWKAGSGIIPKILHVDIVGKDISTGRRVVERIRPEARSRPQGTTR